MTGRSTAIGSALAVTRGAAALLAAVAAVLLRAQPLPPNVLFITLDTVRADHLGAYGYAKGATPSLDRLAREGVRFADATTQSPLTGPAHAALLTGQYPARYGVRDNASTPLPGDVTTAAELFKARGYRTVAFVSAFILDAQYGFAQGFDTFDAAFSKFSVADKLKARRGGAEVTDAALKWLATKSDRPFFAWVHLYDAHAPYDAPAAYRARFRTAPYDAAVSFVDSSVGRLVAALELNGTLDRTIVCVVADHGEALGDHGEAEHGMFLYEPVLHVPWLLRLPGRLHAGGAVSEQVRAIDVLPTIAELAGVGPVPKADGESVVPLINGGARRDPPPSYAETYYPKLHFGWSDLKSVRVGAWKYIDAPRAELYDMTRDRAERQNLFEARGPLASGLSAELAKIQAGFGPVAAARAPQPDRETIARLQSLGYIGVTAQSAGVRGTDPKDRIAGFEAFKLGMGNALKALQRGEASAAVPILRRLVKDNDRSYELHLFLGDAYLGTKQYRNALDEYGAATLLNPANATPVISSARAYLEQGDSTAALERLEAADRLEPGTGEIAFVRGMVFERQGRTADAIREFEAAVRVNGSDPQPRAHLASLALGQGQYEHAREQFTALVRLGFRPSRMHFGLGQATEGLGDRAGAVAEYREALRLEPGLAPARSALTRLGVAAGSARK